MRNECERSGEAARSVSFRVPRLRMSDVFTVVRVQRDVNVFDFVEIGPYAQNKRMIKHNILNHYSCRLTQSFPQS